MICNAKQVAACMIMIADECCSLSCVNYCCCCFVVYFDEDGDDFLTVILNFREYFICLHFSIE